MYSVSEYLDSPASISIRYVSFKMACVFNPYDAGG